MTWDSKKKEPDQRVAEWQAEDPGDEQEGKKWGVETGSPLPTHPKEASFQAKEKFLLLPRHALSLPANSWAPPRLQYTAPEGGPILPVGGSGVGGGRGRGQGAAGGLTLEESAEFSRQSCRRTLVFALFLEADNFPREGAQDLDEAWAIELKGPAAGLL